MPTSTTTTKPTEKEILKTNTKSNSFLIFFSNLYLFTKKYGTNKI